MCEPSILQNQLRQFGVIPRLRTVNYCRFCNREETKKTAAFISVHSPLDTQGQNADLPPSLRRTTWCRKHYRSWMKDAMQSLSTIQIIAHISEKARPMQVAIDDENVKTRSKRRNCKRIKMRHPSEATDESSAHDITGIKQTGMLHGFHSDASEAENSDASEAENSDYG